MTEVEAVAEALANSAGARNGCPPIRNCLALMPPDLAEKFREDAQAALTAMNLDAMREAKAAFTAGWLTANNRRDVPPEEAWLTYLDCKEAAALKEQRRG